MTLVHALLAATALTLPLAAWAEGTSPWLPIPGQLTLNLGYTQQSAKAAYIGSTEVPLSAITSGAAQKYQRTTTTLRLGYGVSDALAVDLAVGSGQVKVGNADSDSGSQDSVLGLSWRALDEYASPGLPTLTLRVAAILKGSYDGQRLAAIGNHENGFEASILLGKQIMPIWSVWGELGVQNRSGQVPNANFYELGTRLRVAPGLSLSLGYASKKYSGNLDVGGTGFSPARFQEVKAERGVTKLGVAYAFAGNQAVALNLGQVSSGRNTPKDDRITGLSYTLAF
jgi:hypothetical protein